MVYVVVVEVGIVGWGRNDGNKGTELESIVEVVVMVVLNTVTVITINKQEIGIGGERGVIIV